MYSLGGIDSTIISRSDIKIKILVLNIHDDKLLNAYESMKGSPIKGPATAYYFLKNLSSCSHVEIKEIDVITPVMFVACDMNYSYGYIKAEHFLNNTEHDKLPNIELTNDKDWYGTYKNNIENIWNRGKPYNWEKGRQMAQTSREIQPKIKELERQISDLHVYLSNADEYSAPGYRQQIRDLQEYVSRLRYELTLAQKEEKAWQQSQRLR